MRLGHASLCPFFLLSLCLLGATFIKYKCGESFPTGWRTHSDVYLAEKHQLAKEKHCFVDSISLPLENQMDVVCSLNNGFNQLSPPKAWNDTASHLTICLDCVEWNFILFKRKSGFKIAAGCRREPTLWPPMPAIFHPRNEKKMTSHPLIGKINVPRTS